MEEEDVSDSIMSRDRAVWMAMTQPSPTRPSPVRWDPFSGDANEDHVENHYHLENDDGKHSNGDGGIVAQGSRSFEARDEVDDQGSGTSMPSPACSGSAVPPVAARHATNKEREPSPFSPRDTNAIEGYFKVRN